MALCSRSCLAVFLVVCLATPLFASPLFFNIFRKNGTRAARTTTASPNNFDIDFSISSNDDASEPTFLQRVRSTARLVSALLKSFFTVVTNRNNNDSSRSLELTTGDPFADLDPFGVEPSESDIDFFATLDNPSDATSRGRSLDSNSDASSSPTGDPTPELEAEKEAEEPSTQVMDPKPDGEEAVMNDQNEDLAVDSGDSGSSSPNAGSKSDADEVVMSDQNEGMAVVSDDSGSSSLNTDSKPDGDEAVMSDQNESMAVDSGDTGSSSPNAGSNLISPDVRKAILLGSARLV